MTYRILMTERVVECVARRRALAARLVAATERLSTLHVDVNTWADVESTLDEAERAICQLEALLEPDAE